MKNKKRNREFTCAFGGRNFPSSLLVDYAHSCKTSSARGAATQLGGPWLRTGAPLRRRKQVFFRGALVGFPWWLRW